MQTTTVERVESWDSRPFPGGFRELHDLADAEFSGAVVADGTWLFMLNGRVIGVFEGDISDFEDATGTVYEAPHPSVALLFSMQERGGETQAKYYTNDTPLSEASQTLADANFTGYIELSENVLSGDYYVVYYGGRSMSAAFVGTNEKLVSGDEAFEQADDEVGVYEVKKVPVNVTSIPNPDADADSDSSSAAAGAAGAGASAASRDDDPDQATGTEEPTDAGTDASAGGTTETARERAAGESGGSGATSSGQSADASEANSGSSHAPAEAASERAAAESNAATGASGSGGAAAATETAESDDGSEVFDEEEQWRNTNSVPTLDPDESEADGGTASRQSSTQQQQRAQSSGGRTKTSQSKQPTSARAQSATGGSKTAVEKLKRAVEDREAKLEEAAERIENLEADRDDLRERVETLQRERDELQAKVDEIEEQLEMGGGQAAQRGGTDMNPAAALSETNLFVRYDSKGQPTLDELDGETDPEAVNQNLRIDHHTQFDDEDVTVEGEPFEAFLRQTTAYRFVSWAVRELPFEIRDSGHTGGLADLYAAIPDIDRAELDGTVAVDTEDGTVSRTFDVVLRDRMGNPLLVAELNAEREPVTGDEMGALVEAATDVRAGADELASALYVTASFFEPAALETAEEETGGGGFLSRSDKASYVSVGRKSGYHLCLVEDRNDAFHLTVPEL